jgi:lipoprotein-releasing system permease protein
VSIQLGIAVTHLIIRKRPTLVSLTGIVLGVAFFLAVSSLMRGSEYDFIKRLIDNSPHITVSDEYRNPAEATGGRAGRTARSKCGGSSR